MEDIAIIGMSFRFPGHCNDVPEFWELLYTSKDAITTSDARWGDQTPLPTNKYAGFLDDVECFDSNFFSILPKEALKMDPQHRQLMELHWEALESACIPLEEVRGSRTGVFAGVSWNQYQNLSLRSGLDRATAMGHHDLYLTTGTTHSLASGRVSFFFDLRGPSITIDTACSSSLVATHLACQSLRTCECDMAFASGISLNLSPETSTNFTQAGMLGDRCRAFDVNANGYVRSEGGAVLVLKKYSRAVEDGSRVLGLLKTTALNQDGHGCTGITAPNTQAQQELYRMALRSVNLSPREIDYIEAHGTGTSVGDPVELGSIVEVFGEISSKANSKVIGVGSVKTNIGHTEMAAGLAGIIKIILALEKEHLPPSLHFTSPNPKAPCLERTGLEILAAGRKWPKRDSPRYATISSYGFSGTNAIAIVCDAPDASKYGAIQKIKAKSGAMGEAAVTPAYGILTLSARTKLSLDGLRARYLKHLAVTSSSGSSSSVPAWMNTCYTSNVGRTHFSQHRCAIVIDGKMSGTRDVEKYFGSEEGSMVGGSKWKIQPTMELLLTGCCSKEQVKEAARFFEIFEPFRTAMEDCADKIRQLCAFELLDIIHQPSVSGACKYEKLIPFSIEYSFAQLLLKMGVSFTRCTCFGLGEYVGACVSGMLDLASTIKLLVSLSDLSDSSLSKYTMIGVGGDISGMPTPPDVTIVQIRQPKTSARFAIVCGLAEHMKHVSASILQRGLCVQALTGFEKPASNVSSAFIQIVKGLSRSAPSIMDFRAGIDGVTVRRSDPPISDSFWLARGSHSESDANRSLELDTCVFAMGIRHEANLALTNELQTSAGSDSSWLTVFDEKSFYDTVAALYKLGGTLDFRRLHSRTSSALRLIDIPKYAFDKSKKYWYPPTPLSRKALGSCSREHDLVVLSHVTLCQDKLRRLEIEAPSRWAPEVQSYEDDLQELCLCHILAALVMLAGPDPLSSGISTKRLEEMTGVVAQYHPFFQHLIAKLADAGYLRYINERDEVVGKGGRAIPTLEELRAKADRLAHELRGKLEGRRSTLMEISNQMGGKLHAVLRGEANPLKTLFPSKQDGSCTYSIERFYEEFPDLVQCNTLAKEILRALVPRISGASGAAAVVRVLEVGAGTGSTTRHMLESLSTLERQVEFEYVFTDISSVFFRGAREKLVRLAPAIASKVSYKVLNLELEPGSQGFTPHSFDVVIGSNVVHATKCIQQSLEHIGQLLRAEGILVLCEYIQPILALDVAFGSLNGWWRFKESDPDRSDHAFMSPATWTRVLNRAGFVDAKCLGYPVAVIIAANGKYVGQCGHVLGANQQLQREDYTPENLEIVRQALIKIVSEVTGLEPNEIDEDAEMRELGLDSLMKIELANKLTEGFGLKEASQLVDRHPCLSALTKAVAATRDRQPMHSRPLSSTEK